MNKIIKPVPYDYSTTLNTINQLKNLYPFIDVSIIGESVWGNKIHSLKIGNKNSYVLIASSFHGREWITTPILLLFAERLCRALILNKEIAGINAQKAFTYNGLILVPLVNPDGVDISLNCIKENTFDYKSICPDLSQWCANARGVDINHNFNAGWTALKKLENEKGITSPCSSKFGGYTAESEPETKSITSLCKKYDISHVMALHTQGEEIYWRYGNLMPKNSERMARVLSASSGYKLIDAEGTASFGGFKDWFIEKYNKPGFTVEIGKGKSPLPIEQLYSLYFRLEEMLMLTLIM